MLQVFSENDITDIFEKFKDRFIARQICQCFSNTKVNVESENKNAEVDISLISSDLKFGIQKNCKVTDSDTGNSTSKGEKYTIEELLKKKPKRGKPTPAQAYFSNVMKDAATAAHIWKKCPKLCEISEQKREAFFRSVSSVLPDLVVNKKEELWKRLGENLQNRRKYLMDKITGKRSPKSKGGHKKLPQPSSTVSQTTERGLVKASSGTYTAKNKNLNSVVSTTSSSISSSSVSTSVTNIKLLTPGATVDIFNRREEFLGVGLYLREKDELYVELALHSMSKNITDEPYNELPMETEGVTNFKDLNVKSVFLWKKELVQLKQSAKSTGEKRRTSSNSSECILKKPKTTAIKPVTGKNLETQSEIKKSSKTSCEKRKSLNSNLPRPECTSKKSKTTTIKPVSTTKSEIVVIEWSAGELYLGVLKTSNAGVFVHNCSQPLGRIIPVDGTCTDGKRSDFYVLEHVKDNMLKINNKDIQKEPDMDFLVWKICEANNHLARFDESKKKIFLPDENLFLSSLRTQLDNYL